MQELTWDMAKLSKSCLLFAGYAYKYFHSCIVSDDFLFEEFSSWNDLLDVIQKDLPASVNPRAIQIKEDLLQLLLQIRKGFWSLYDRYNVDVGNCLYNFIDEVADDDDLDRAEADVNQFLIDLKKELQQVETLLVDLQEALKEKPAPVTWCRRQVPVDPIVDVNAGALALSKFALKVAARRDKKEV